MDKMNRNILVLVVGTLLVAAIAGCGSSSSTPPPPPPDLKTFVTSSVFDGNLIAAEGTSKANGILAADALCMKDANYPGTGTYKAMIVDGVNRIASVTANAGDGQVDWVLKANTKYFQSDGTTQVMTTNANKLFTFGTLDNPFDAVPTDMYWTGLNLDWTTYPDQGGNNQNCSGWSYNTSNAAPYGTFAMGGLTDNGAIYWSFNAFCHIQQFYLICVQQ